MRYRRLATELVTVALVLFATSVALVGAILGGALLVTYYAAAVGGT